ncbi:MAG: LamG-like jellyroll fold domain-containing protein [Pseudomonadota bacterium]
MSRYFIPVSLLLCVGSIAFLALLRVGGEHVVEVEPIPGALVQLAFENDLSDSGAFGFLGDIKDGRARFKDGVEGRAFDLRDDGSWLEYSSSVPLTINQPVEISFDLQWAGEGGHMTQTVAVLTGRRNGYLRHLSFGITNNRLPHFQVQFDGGDGNPVKLRTDPGSVSKNWHRVTLRVDRLQPLTSLYFDGELAASTPSAPPGFDGITKIKLGTWFKNNQSYRGLLDNFVVRDLSVSVPGGRRLETET